MGCLQRKTCGTSRQQRIQTGWRLAKTFWIKIVSSRGHSLQAGTISSSATTRSGRFWAALRRLGIYSGQVDGILGPDTHRAIEDYQVKNKLPVTGQPDQMLNALLGVF